MDGDIFGHESMGGGGRRRGVGNHHHHHGHDHDHDNGMLLEQEFDSKPMITQQPQQQKIKIEVEQQQQSPPPEAEEEEGKAGTCFSTMTNNNTVNGNGGGRWSSIAERRAAKCGFDASNMGGISITLPNCITIPSGISPTALLDSPVMLPNAQAQVLSPTTGSFYFPSSSLQQHTTLLLNLLAKPSSANTTDDSSSSFMTPMDQTNASAPQPFVLPNATTFLENQLLKDFETTTTATKEAQQMSDNKSLDTANTHPTTSNDIVNVNDYQMSHQCNDKELGTNQNIIDKDPKCTPRSEIAKNSDDGYNWRKYGQKHVKGSEYPRSYYKCTHTSCPVRKKVERSHDGQITEIVYKSSHNHPKPLPFRRSLLGPSSSFDDITDVTEIGVMNGDNNIRFGGCGSDWRAGDGLDRMSPTSSFPNGFSDPFTKSMNAFETAATPEFSSTLVSLDSCGGDEAAQDTTSIEDDAANDESEPKRRKKDNYIIETNVSSRSIREPRVVVQIESDIDILDDGYRWRKYGQKVVKGNPNPRSYYKCTTVGCPVRKHVERAADNFKSVITTYEGKHNHEVPSSKTSGQLVISNVANLPHSVTNSTQAVPSLPRNLDMLKPAGIQVHDIPLYFDRKPLLGNKFVRPNMVGNYVNDLNFGPSSIFPVTIPRLSSMTPYGSGLPMNMNNIETFPASSISPMVMPDYMPISSQMSSSLPTSATANMPMNSSFYFNYRATRPNSTAIPSSIKRQQEINETMPKI